MTPDAVAIINYPGHFLSSLLTIKRIDELVEWDCPFYFFVDDVSDQYKQWPGNYIDDLKVVLTDSFDHDFHFILFSEFPFTQTFDGWFRQQFVKLAVDEFLPGSNWYITDSDVMPMRIISPREVPYFYPMETVDDEKNFQIMTNNYRNYMLGLEDSRLIVNEKEIYTNVAPFRWLSRELLNGLRKHCENHFMHDFFEHQIHLIDEGELVAGFGEDNTKMIMSEWELIEAYRHLVKQYDFEWVYMPPTDFKSEEHVDKENGFITGYELDFEIGKDFFQNKGLTVNDDQWQKCSSLSRTEIY